MTIEEWQAALNSIKDFVGTFSINFSGGEPFISARLFARISGAIREAVRRHRLFARRTGAPGKEFSD
jgi:hypothetical protein